MRKSWNLHVHPILSLKEETHRKHSITLHVCLANVGMKEIHPMECLTVVLD